MILGKTDVVAVCLCGKLWSGCLGLKVDSAALDLHRSHRFLCPERQSKPLSPVCG